MGKFSTLLLSTCVFTALLFGQGTVGSSSVTGRVTDPSGAVIGGADVSLTDTATAVSQSTHSNSAGLYIFNNVAPGKYDISVSKTGFSRAAVRAQDVLVGTATTVNVTLEVGAVSEVVEVKTSAGAELQTLNATMGATIPSEGLLEMPTINRDVSSLLFTQATAAPTFSNAENNITSGQIAGNMADQNTYMLDGGNSTSDLDGDNGTYVGSRSGVIPTPVESVEEIRVNTNNMTADFNSSNGGQMIMTTKRGTNQFHGSAYDFFQSDVMAANDWFNNFHDLGKPKSHYNRFGGSFGGPVLPNFLGGKTYIYMNYEGERYPRSGPFEKTVPSDSLRAGIVKFRDAAGNIISYNLGTSTACGASGGQPCDPRGVGISPVVSQVWSKYMPECNDQNFGDRLNTCGFISALTYPLSTNFGVVRMDHDFGNKWRWFSSYRYFSQQNPDTNQVDIGGLLPGDTKGHAAAVSSTPVNPRYLVTGLTGTLTPNLTNEFHFSYTRNQWQWLRPGAVPQLPGIEGALGIGGESANALIPMNINTQQARNRLWDGHDYSYRDTLSWLKGTHLFQFGGEIAHQWWKFDRYDNVVGGLTQLVDDVSSGGVHFDDNFRPIACTDAITSNCLPSAQNANWASVYTELLGIVDKTSVVVTRSGSNLTANPLGSPVHSYVTDQTYSIYFNDSWKIKPNVTISYGLNYAVQLPPYELNGAQDVLTNATGQIITEAQYFQSTVAAANKGQVYNPVLGFTPVRDIAPGNKYVYRPFYGAFAPRVAVAWNPQTNGGWLGKIFGDKATVIRTGFGRFYSHSLGIDLVSTPVLGDGFLQPVGCANPNKAGACTGPGQVDPSNAFRVGVDGLNPPVGAITPTLPIPVTPGYNAPYATLAASLDN
ncbi:MAG TPA: carboxypeptidase-like regulatory domain-containing protein, partial [Bryobacteraceae bacterium]|nr:carboxypeptidase-like regulatory domain-containing protein [Bryobacteraceae bacterium]